jgi:hypothetical protein
MAFNNHPLQKHLPLAMIAPASEPLSMRKKMKKIRGLPTPILRKEAGKDEGHPQSFPFLSPPLGYVQAITCGLDVRCALVERRLMTLKGTPFKFLNMAVPDLNIQVDLTLLYVWMLVSRRSTTSKFVTHPVVTLALCLSLKLM